MRLKHKPDSMPLSDRNFRAVTIIFETNKNYFMYEHCFNTSQEFGITDYSTVIKRY